MISKIKNILLFLNTISYITTFFQLIVLKNFEFGVVFSFISMVLSLFLYLLSHEQEFKQTIMRWFSFDESKSTFKKQFTYFSILYVIASICIYLIGAILDLSFFIFINLFILPCIFSIFMLYMKMFFTKHMVKYLGTFYIIIAVPHLLFGLMCIFISRSLIEIILALCATALFYIPTYLFCKLIDKMCKIV